VTLSLDYHAVLASLDRPPDTPAVGAALMKALTGVLRGSTLHVERFCNRPSSG
jgi:hypothetical protein